MSSPQKRQGRPVPNGPAAAQQERSLAFPPIRSRSPKKKEGKISDNVSKRHRDAKSLELPRVSSDITYANSEQHQVQVPDNGEELEVLKCILVREGYLQRLTQASVQGRVSGSGLSTTIDVLDLLRVATIECVESIVTWRLRKRKLEPKTSAEPLAFRWNSFNYLLKMASDLDFLEKHQGLVQWLGFTLVRNPFILPVNLDTRQRLEPGIASQVTDTSLRRLTRDESSSQFVQVGGKRSAVDQGPDEATAQWRAARAADLAERKRAKNPYETRVINDEDLVPLSRAPAKTPTATKRSSSAASAVLLPSQIGELDMTRIRACEQVILQEEATHGRYTRDIQGRVVPASEAQRLMDMVELSDDAYRQRRQEQDLDTNGAERQECERSDPPEDSSSEHGVLKSGLQPKARAKKRAGMLGPISKPRARVSTRKAPVDRSRGAHLEEVLRQERLANEHLGVLIDRVREEIERKEMDLAYFESFPGVQHFGGELDEFRKKTRAEVSVLRRDLAEKQYVLATRTANLNRKEEIIHVFKENRSHAVDAERGERIARVQRSSDGSEAASPLTSNQDVESAPQTNATPAEGDPPAQNVPTMPITLTAPLVHDMCAILIQKIARGKLARAAFQVMRIEYYVGSKYIQAVVRGFLARRRVAKLYWQLTASVVLQRFARGLLARRFVARKRHERERQRAALRIQRVLRGHFGRRRMRRVRRLFFGGSQLHTSAACVTLSDLKELADACARMAALPPPPSSGIRQDKRESSSTLSPLVLGLVRILMVFTSDRDDAVDVCGTRWKEAAQFLRCSARLQRRMSKVGSIVGRSDRALRSSILGMALLDMHSKDENFSEQTFSHLETGWRAAAAIYKWIMGFATVCREQDVFQTSRRPSARPFTYAEATNAMEAMQERAEEVANATEQRATERQFVPWSVVRLSQSLRTRAMILVVAFDVPRAARAAILGELRRSLPGIFVVLNRRNQIDERVSKSRKQQIQVLGADYSSIREAIDVGHSVVLDCDVGLTDAQQRRFLSTFTALKAAVKPSPQCMLLRGCLRNRHVWDEVEQEPEGEVSPRALVARADASRSRVMADQDVKRAFERSAELLGGLQDQETKANMLQVSAGSAFDVSPSASVGAAFVLVMEAVVVLLTPAKRYEIPQHRTSGVSWKLARRLLANPAFFVAKLGRVSYDNIAAENLRVLHAYLQHADWPSAATSHVTACGLLHRLAAWVESVVRCAQMAQDRHGFAASITRTTPVPGLFDSVVTYHNYLPVDGKARAAQELVDASLADTRVYRKVHVLDGQRCVVTVFHDCHRIFFSAYDPDSSWRWQRTIDEEEVDMLLAPNSIERGDDMKRFPPATRTEIYDRLVRLCLLQAARKPQLSTAATPTGTLMEPQQRELIVRPPAIRLFRQVIRLGGHRATVTLAELSRGRVQVDVALHGCASIDLRRIASVEEILQRTSHTQARDVFVEPEHLPAMVLERLHLFRLTQSSSRDLAVSSPRKDENSRAPPMLKLVVRTKDTAPGRVLVRRAIRSRWLEPPSATGVSVWLLTVLEQHGADCFRVEVYQPRTCSRFVRFITKRELQDLGLRELCQRPSSAASAELLRVITRFFEFQTGSNGDDEGDGLRIVECALRHRTLTRFPLAIRFTPREHHVVDDGGVKRCYVQVETREDSTAGAESVRIRVCLSESCEEQAIELQDAQVDSFFAESPEKAWRSATRAERQRMAFVLARSTLQWDPNQHRVTATLPCGSFVGAVCTRDTGRRRAPVPDKTVAKSKRTLFTARSSLSPLPTPSSCVVLLDWHGGESSNESECLARHVFVYERNELIHQGSFRANGVLFTVQAFMKAVVLTRSQPRLPVDRVEQEDSFEIAIDFYHPATSSQQRCVIKGLRDLREVVGLERAALIASSTVHELMTHIIESRTSVSFDASVPGCVHVALLRDRLYAKQKATPIQGSLEADAHRNAAKLIDAKSDRGLKLLTKTRAVGERSGRVIFTVFDVVCTRGESVGVRLRVDAFECSTSVRLSLSLETADFVHILPDTGAVALISPSGEEVSPQRKMELAHLVVDHVGIARKRDGSADRLFLVDTVVEDPSRPRSLSPATRLIGKTVRHVRHHPIVVSVFTSESGDERPRLSIQCYEPQSSASAEVEVPADTLLEILGLPLGGERVTQVVRALDVTTTRALMARVLSFVHFDISLSGDEKKTLSASLCWSEEDAREAQRSRELLRSHGGRNATEPPVASWCGLATAGVDHARELCAVAVAVQCPDPSSDLTRAVLRCSALALRERIVGSRAFSYSELQAMMPTELSVKPEAVAEECVSRLRIRVVRRQRESSDSDAGDRAEAMVEIELSNN